MKTVTAKELKEKLEKNEVLLVDVRRAEERAKAYIPGAIFITLSELSTDKLPTRSLPIVFHCAGGKRSITAGEKILEQDPNLEVYSLTGGIKAWEKEGFAVNLK